MSLNPLHLIKGDPLKDETIGSDDKAKYPKYTRVYVAIITSKTSVA